MSDFLDYYKKTEQANAMTEEEQLALHKKHKLIAAQRHKIDEEDDFYNSSHLNEIGAAKFAKILLRDIKI